MTRPIVIVWLGLVSVLLTLAGLAYDAQAEPLNVILVMTDDQGYCDFGVHGNPVVRTPHLDALARQSVRFTDFHVNPFCSPTRAAVLTGRMSDRTGVTRTNYQYNYLRREEVLMPEYFLASGYRTGIFGKWHVGGNFPYRPIDRGFQHWIGLGNNGLATTADFWDNDRLDDTYWRDGEPARIDGFCTDVYFSEAMHFMEAARRQGGPFFAYIATNVPHWDWNVRPEWLEPYRDHGHHERACFYASVERADWNVGRLVDYLVHSGLDRNTLLVFLTDNGSDVPGKESAFAAGLRGWKGSLYEGGHRVPCFVHGPRELVGPPREIDAFTAHVDLLPTFVDLCHLEQPPRTPLPWDGRSMRPLLQGDGEWSDRMLVMHVQNALDVPRKGHNAVVMTAKWRLVNGRELYDIRNDRGQQQDVAGQHPEVIDRLRKAYDQHWESLELETRPLERPVLGGAGSPTLRLSSDLTRESNFIWQQNVRRGDFLRQPIWLLDVTRKGRYRFEVRRWPREVDQPLTASLPPTEDPRLTYCGHADSRIDVPGKALPIAEVELKLSTGQALRKRVAADDRHITFEVDLPVGPVDLEAWFLDHHSQRLTGAYYVYAEAVHDPGSASDSEREAKNVKRRQRMSQGCLPVAPCREYPMCAVLPLLFTLRIFRLQGRLAANDRPGRHVPVADRPSAARPWRLGLIAVVTLLLPDLGSPTFGQSVFPGREWATKSPEEVGLSTSGLRGFSELVGGRGCVVRHGVLVYTWGDATRRGDVASACKPWYSHFLFKALETGKLESVDEKIARRWEPRLSTLNGGLGFKDRQITWKHFATQTSCYEVTDEPGTAFCYNDWQMALFWDLLFLKVYGVTNDSVDERVLHPLLTDVLECQDQPTFMAFGTHDRPGRVGVSPRDFCRFGLLYLHRGNWNGQQLLDERYAVMAVSCPLPNSLPRAVGGAAEMLPGQRSLGSTRQPDNQCDHAGSYSWLWWTNGVDRDGRRHWPDAPEDLYGCFGHGGPRVMIVIPSLDLVVSWNDAQVKDREAENAAFQRLVASVARPD